MSGYTADALSPGGVIDASIALIEKPAAFSIATLAAKVRDVLDAPLPAGRTA
jgi:hypothetical protein